MDDIGTPQGLARVDRRPASAAHRATLVLGHGAGGGIGAPDLAWLAERLPFHGIAVVLVEAPWRVAGRRVATPPVTLDRAWLAVLAALRVQGPLIVGGRSAGARVACRTAVATGATGVLALAFPLQPPARAARPPAPSRLGELQGAGVPTLVVQGERDPFGGSGAFPAPPRVSGSAPLPTYVVVGVPGADHAFRVTRAHDPAATLAGIAATVTAWVLDLVP